MEPRCRSPSTNEKQHRGRSEASDDAPDGKHVKFDDAMDGMGQEDEDTANRSDDSESSTETVDRLSKCEDDDCNAEISDFSIESPKFWNSKDRARIERFFSPAIQTAIEIYNTLEDHPKCSTDLNNIQNRLKGLSDPRFERLKALWQAKKYAAVI